MLNDFIRQRNEAELMTKARGLHLEAERAYNRSSDLDSSAEKHLQDGNECEWENDKMESVELDAYARGIEHTLEVLGLKIE